MKTFILVTCGLTVVAVVIKNRYDIYQLARATEHILYHIHQKEYDLAFVSIVEEGLSDLDEE